MDTHNIWMVTQCRALPPKNQKHTCTDMVQLCNQSDASVFAGCRVQPDPVLCGQVLLLVICGLRTEDALVKPSHDVLLHLVHHWFHGLRGAWRRAHAGQRGLAGCSSDVLDCRRGLTPTFEVTHQAVGHVLVEILDTLGQFVCAQVLKGSQIGQSPPGLQTINR